MLPGDVNQILFYLDHCSDLRSAVSAAQDSES